jgi:hypothetical protein
MGAAATTPPVPAAGPSSGGYVNTAASVPQ